MLTILVPPVGEPVSSAELKAHLRVTHAAEDDLFPRLIAAARSRLESSLGLTLIQSVVRETIDAPAAAVVPLSTGPVASVDACAVPDGLGGWTALAPDAFLREGERPARVRLRLRPSAVRVDYHAGLAADPASVPASLKQAVLVLAAEAYERRDDPLAPAPTGLGGAEPWVAAYRRARL